MFGEAGLLNSNGVTGNGLTGNGNGGGHGFAPGEGIGTGAAVPSGMPPGTMVPGVVPGPLPGTVLPQIDLPPVVPPIPGANDLGPAGAVAADSKGEGAGFALKWEPPPFERTIDPASPQSLLGPSSHRAPGSTAPPKPAMAPPEMAPPEMAPPAVAPPATIPVEPRQASGPTPQDLLFGTPQPVSEAPLSEPNPKAVAPTQVATPETETPETVAPSSAPAPTITPAPAAPAPAAPAPPAAAATPLPAPAVTHNHTSRDRLLRKLMKPKALIPIAVLVIAGAMVASVMATTSTKVPAKAVTKTSTVGTHPSTKPLAHGTPPRAATAKTLAIALRSPADDPRPDITVRVGNDAAIHVVLDTGSVGLRVFSNLVPTGVNRGIHITGPQDSIEYVDGTQFSGPVAQALVHIGKLTTTTTVPFQLVQSVTCDPAIPDCPASGGATQFEADGVDGIMGIGLTGPYPGDPTTNPLLSLPAPYRNSWSIEMQGGGRTLPAPGTLILGARTPTAPAADFALQQEGASVHGLPTWNDQFNLCWTVGGISSCELSVFDSGSDLTVLGGTQFASVPTDDPGQIGTLTTGTAVQASQEVDSNPLWSFTSGGGAMQTVIVEPAGINWVNSGVQAFYSFTVTYNEVSGAIYLS